jgi:hypothetical protein
MFLEYKATYKDDKWHTKCNKWRWQNSDKRLQFCLESDKMTEEIYVICVSRRIDTIFCVSHTTHLNEPMDAGSVDRCHFCLFAYCKINKLDQSNKRNVHQTKNMKNEIYP